MHGSAICALLQHVDQSGSAQKEGSECLTQSFDFFVFVFATNTNEKRKKISFIGPLISLLTLGFIRDHSHRS